MASVLSKKIFLKQEVEDLRKKLNQAIASNEGKNRILYLSQELDKLIDLYYKYYME